MVGLTFSPLLQPQYIKSVVRRMYQIQSQYITNICTSTLDGHKHNLTMVSDASPGTAAPKINKSFVHMACMCSDRPCAQDGYLKCPHRTIIDGDMWWDSSWVWVVFELGDIGLTISQAEARQKNTPQSWRPPLPYGRHGAFPPAPPHTTISQHAAG